ncbi:hypothetical protein [Bacillus thuringiensis]|nr:hypothetical protein [Bacillus thuringiensis]
MYFLNMYPVFLNKKVYQNESVIFIIDSVLHVCILQLKVKGVEKDD